MNYVPLKRLVDPRRPITYGIVQAGEDVPGGVPYIRPIDMPAFARDLDPGTLRTTSPAIAAAYQRSTVATGDVIVSIGPSYGKLLLISPRLAGSNLTQGTARVAPAAGVDARFLQWALASPGARAHWHAAVGGATFGGLNLGPLSTTPVPAIDHGRQRCIAAFLDRECARIAALITESAAFADVTVSSSAQVAERRLLAGENRNGRLKHILQAPLAYGVLKPEEPVDEPGVPLIRITDIGTEGISRSASLLRIPAAQSEEFRRTRLNAGDVLVSVVGTIGRAAVVPPWLQSANISRAIARVQPRKEFAPTFVRELFRLPSFERFWKSETYGTAQVVLNLSTLKEMPILFPSNVEDRAEVAGRMADIWAAADRVTRETSGLIQLLWEYRDALIAKAITGQLDVTRTSESSMNDELAALREGDVRVSA